MRALTVATLGAVLIALAACETADSGGADKDVNLDIGPFTNWLIMERAKTDEVLQSSKKKKGKIGRKCFKQCKAAYDECMDSQEVPDSFPKTSSDEVGWNDLGGPYGHKPTGGNVPTGRYEICEREFVTCFTACKKE